jgi:hypothetical protein
MVAAAGDQSHTQTAPKVTVTPHASTAWIAAFGPVGAGSDGYLMRVETNAMSLASLGFKVDVLELSKRANPSVGWANVRIHPTLPFILHERRVLGSLNLLSDFRAQLSFAVGLLRNWRNMRAAQVVVIEGAFFAMALSLRFLRRGRRPLLVFDLITLMSTLHRDTSGKCTFQCKLRRGIWWFLERICVTCADVVATGNEADAGALRASQVRVLPHAVLEVSLRASQEDPNLLGFLGNGHVLPNRRAVEFLVSSVLNHPGLESVRCRVIGDQTGYALDAHNRLEFAGFSKDSGNALSRVSVCCAPMEGAGGVSTKVLEYLMSGKRTVCTPESAQGVARPPAGLWVVELHNFAEAVAAALAEPWSAEQASSLRHWMIAHHGLKALQSEWQQVLLPSVIE